MHQLINLALTISICPAFYERYFSTMRRIKTYIKSTMSQDRISSLTILNMERDVFNNVNSNYILDIYAKEKGHLRLPFFFFVHFSSMLLYTFYF